jgi:hypothetical protein
MTQACDADWTKHHMRGRSARAMDFCIGLETQKVRYHHNPDRKAGRKDDR